MSSKICTILIIVLLTTIIVLAGVFCWQTKKSPLSDMRRSPNIQENNSQFSASKQNSQLPQTTENEIATTSPPFQIKGEISRGNTTKKQIIFTFDGGAGIHSAQKILAVAKNHNLKTTFFVTGKFAERNPDLIKKIAAEGHEIFNHTYSHPHLTQLTDEQIKEELDKADQIIGNLTGTSTKPYFRPPYGERNVHVLEVAAQNGYQSVVWTFDALDWMNDKTPEQVKEKIYSNLKNSAIILMHLGDDITGNILDEVFTKIENEGYEIVSLTEGIK